MAFTFRREVWSGILIRSSVKLPSFGCGFYIVSALPHAHTHTHTHTHTRALCDDAGPCEMRLLSLKFLHCSTTYITCPSDPKQTLGIKLPFLVMIIKNLKKYFTFEVQVRHFDDVRRWKSNRKVCTHFLISRPVLRFVASGGDFLREERVSATDSLGPQIPCLGAPGLKSANLCA